jgi:hypothetical protein
MPKCTSNVLEGVLRSFQRSRRCTCGFRNVQAGLSLHGRVLRNLDAKARPGEGFPADSMTDVRWLKTRYFGIGWRVVEGLQNGLSGPECRLEFGKGVHCFVAEESWRCSSELGSGWEVTRCRARLRTKGAGDTLEAGQGHERMPSRFTATRQSGCRRPRRTYVGIFHLDAKFMAGVLNQCGTRHPE